MNRPSTPVFAFTAAVALFACGGSVDAGAPDASLSDSGADATSHDAAIDARSDATAADGGCVADPHVAFACNPGDVACPEQGDPCCRGYVLTCEPTSGTWQKTALACDCLLDAGTDAAATDAALSDASTTACGPKTCTASQYCTTSSGGAQLPDGGVNTYYDCTPLPAACASTPTCACVNAHGTTSGACPCTDVDGRATATCYLP